MDGTELPMTIALEDRLDEVILLRKESPRGLRKTLGLSTPRVQPRARAPEDSRGPQPRKAENEYFGK